MLVQQKSKIKTNSGFLKVISKAKEVLTEYDLCEDCVGRLFAKNLELTSNKLLGKKLIKILKIKPASKCYICKNILTNLSPYLEKMLQLMLWRTVKQAGTYNRIPFIKLLIGPVVSGLQLLCRHIHRLICHMPGVV